MATPTNTPTANAGPIVTDLHSALRAQRRSPHKILVTPNGNRKCEPVMKQPPHQRSQSMANLKTDSVKSAFTAVKQQNDAKKDEKKA